jgi:hypothetical protein
MELAVAAARSPARSLAAGKYGVGMLSTRLVNMPTAGSRQLVEQPLRFFQVGGVEALGEPAVDGCEKLLRLAKIGQLTVERDFLSRRSGR